MGCSARLVVEWFQDQAQHRHLAFPILSIPWNSMFLSFFIQLHFLRQKTLLVLIDMLHNTNLNLSYFNACCCFHLCSSRSFWFDSKKSLSVEAFRFREVAYVLFLGGWVWWIRLVDCLLLSGSPSLASLTFISLSHSSVPCSKLNRVRGVLLLHTEVSQEIPSWQFCMSSAYCGIST